MTLNKDTKIIYDKDNVVITEEEKKEIEKIILSSEVYWSDGRDCHWMSDFYYGELCIENYDIKNDFSSLGIYISRPNFLKK